jgi:hypothetical protein
MGTTASSFSALPTDPHLVRLVSATHVTASDTEAWNQILKGSPDLTGYVNQNIHPVNHVISFLFHPPPQQQSNNWCSPNGKLFEDSVTPLLEQLLQNNPSSHNVSSLVTLFEDKCQDLRSLQETNAERSVKLCIMCVFLTDILILETELLLPSQRPVMWPWHCVSHCDTSSKP